MWTAVVKRQMLLRLAIYHSFMIPCLYWVVYHVKYYSFTIMYTMLNIIKFLPSTVLQYTMLIIIPLPSTVLQYTMLIYRVPYQCILFIMFYITNAFWNKLERKALTKSSLRVQSYECGPVPLAGLIRFCLKKRGAWRKQNCFSLKCLTQGGYNKTESSQAEQTDLIWGSKSVLWQRYAENKFLLKPLLPEFFLGQLMY